jgi:hypothetical protein
MKPKTKKCLKRVTISIVFLLVLVFGGFYIYTLDYYRADDNVVQALAANDGSIVNEDGMTVFYPPEEKQTEKGLIFYPGGKVEDISYVPLLERISRSSGITCVLIKMPFNLAVFDINAADAVYEKFPEIKTWYLAGHSLGGAMASSYCGHSSEKLKGLILLGAYPVNDADIPTLAIYGSEDVNLDKAKLENTPNKIEIQGGNHAYFGNYGEQKGDGTATITREHQQRVTAEAIINFIFE